MTSKTFPLRIIAASSIGTLLEWYDFSLFAFLTPILARLFFPQENTLNALMLTYAIFAVGFFVRPLGAMLFGHLGDRMGRQKTLVFSIVLMSVSTFLMGLLPTYQTIGMTAPVILIILRVCQGLSVGGESTGAVLFAIETNTYQRRGFIGGLLWAVVGVGMLLGSLASMIVMQYPVESGLWRIPFVLGIFTGILGYVVRKGMPEPFLFQEILNKGQMVQFPLLEGILKYKKEMLSIIGVYLLSAMITYLIFIFMPAYAANVIGMSLAQTSLISTLGLAGVTLLVPFGGYLSDRVGRKNCLQWGAIGFTLFSYPLYYFISLGSFQNLIIAESLFVILAAIFQGTITTAVIEQLPTTVRYSVIAVGYNISYSLFGGTAPLVATYIVELTNNQSAPGLYLMLGALIALFAASNMRETFKLPLE